MKLQHLLVVVIMVLIGSGCASQSGKEEAEPVPSHAGRVKVVMFDTTPRQESQQFEVFYQSTQIPHSHRDIALLTCEGAMRHETLMTAAIIYRARKMGADAVIILPANAYQEGTQIVLGPNGGFGGGGKTKVIFRAKAIVYNTMSQ